MSGLSPAHVQWALSFTSWRGLTARMKWTRFFIFIFLSFFIYMMAGATRTNEVDEVFVLSTSFSATYLSRMFLISVFSFLLHHGRG